MDIKPKSPNIKFMCDFCGKDKATCNCQKCLNIALTMIYLIPLVIIIFILLLKLKEAL